MSEAQSRPTSQQSSLYDDALEDEDFAMEDSPVEDIDDEDEEKKQKESEHNKKNRKPKMEDLSREERRALALKKAQSRKSNVQIGQRKVKLKIKKAAKSVQGDIDAAKKRLDDFRKRKQLEEERRKLRSAQERKR